MKMLKIEKVLNEKNAKVYALADHTGEHGRANSITRILNGENEITNLSYNTLQAIARGLGVGIEGILEDFDLDGTTGAIITLKRVIEKIEKKMNTYKSEEDQDSIIQIDDNGFVYGKNLDRFNKSGGDFPKPFIYKKEDYEIINPNIPHSEQVTDPVELNASYLDRKDQLKSENNKDITILATQQINACPAVFIYNKLPLGGDLKMIVSVLDKGEVDFTQVFGVEYQDEDENKNIVFYKSTFREPITPEIIEECEKKVISETEFYTAIQTQYNKFKLTK